MVRKAEFLEEFRLTQIETEQQGLFAVQRIDGGDVDTVEGLTDALHVTCDKHTTFGLALGDEVDVGTDGAEGFSCR